MPESMTATPEELEESIPVPPFDAARVPVIVESVEVATHPGIPFTTAST